MQASKTTKYADQSFQQVIEQCDGCERIVEENNTKYCRTYRDPEAKWHLGLCNFATHAKPELNLVKVRVNPLKASKRASSRRK